MTKAATANLDYRLVRAAGRFGAVRSTVQAGCSVVRRNSTERFLDELDGRDSVVQAPDAGAPGAVAALKEHGLATGFRLDAGVVTDLREYAEGATLFADRNPSRGFSPDRRSEAERALGKPILVAQYLNARRDCAAVERVASDPLLARVAADCLGSAPKLVGTSLWWTFPVHASEMDRDLHAHRFHRDVDDFGFVKFFFYLTDVDHADGGHVCVTGSHRTVGPAGRFGLRRFSDDEVERHYPPESITEIVGTAGDGFAEDTFCVHKGLTPTRSPRLLLQLEYALFDHGIAHDHAPETRMLVEP